METFCKTEEKSIFAVIFHQDLNVNRIMQTLVSTINEQIAVFQENAKLQVENNNKAAGARARKASLELEKSLKAFRKASIETSR